MPKVTINGVSLEVPPGTNVVKAAEMCGQEVPHYCYHPALPVAGNCRMCMIDIRQLSEKQPNPLPKLQIGCNTTCQEGMVVETNNERVEEARRGVLEFLLINHPIDCPICDQAGECKLQEYYMDYGRYGSRRPLEDKVHKEKAVAIGPSVMLDQERCILCTRCVRFVEDVTETFELCVNERGDHSRLSLAHGKSLDNDYSLNTVDICPVGALTSREFRFQARVWYLDETDSVCAGCATGCNIEVHAREDNIYRLKPRANDAVNGYWMCDAGRRTAEDNRASTRLESSYRRDEHSFVPFAAEEVAASAAEGLRKTSKPALVVSASLSMEEGYLASRIAEKIGAETKIMISPASSDVADDDFLISTDRYPNRAGLKALGFVESVEPVAGADGALIVRADPAGDNAEGWASVLGKLAYTVLADSSTSATAEYADVILAIGTHFESEGSFVNRSGRLQGFSRAVALPGAAVTGWRALAALLGELGGERFATVEEVFAAMCSSHGLGEGLDYAWLGDQGRSLSVGGSDDRPDPSVHADA